MYLSAELNSVSTQGWLLLVCKLQTSEPLEKFKVKSSSIYICIWPYMANYLQLLESVLDFDPKMLSFKTRKSQGLPLSWNSSQVITWAYKCHFSSLEGFMHNNVMNGCWCDLRRDTREYHQDPPLTRKWERTGAS